MEFFPLDPGQLRGRGGGVGWGEARPDWAGRWGGAGQGPPGEGAGPRPRCPRGPGRGSRGAQCREGGTGRRQQATGGGGWRGWREEEERPRAAEEGEDGEAGAGAGGGHWVPATLELRSGESAEPEGDGTWAGLQGPQGRRQLARAWNSGFWLGWRSSGGGCGTGGEGVRGGVGEGRVESWESRLVNL